MTKEHHRLARDWYVISNNAVARPAVSGASRANIVMARGKIALGKLLNRFHAPGAVQPFMYKDSFTRDIIEVRIGVLFTVFSVNGRDYYFDRLTGRFDGTGQGC